MPDTSRRLEDLLIKPREDLEVEIKPWLNLSDRSDRATLAKAALSLANHGGGFIILGLEEQDDKTFIPAESRPNDLRDYNQDEVNRLIESFADPPFQCHVDYVTQASSGLIFPIVSIPGGHRVPIRSKKDSPEGHKMKQNTYYIRRPGPQSEPPQTATEWDDLMRRCLRNNRDDLLDAMRDILSGRAGSVVTPPSLTEKLDEWTKTCLQRWQELVASLPTDAAPRFPKGYLAIIYVIEGNFKKPNLDELKKILGDVEMRHTGWPLFLLPHKQPEGPYPFDNLTETYIGATWKSDNTGMLGDPAHQDFWRVSPDGKAFVIRGLQEDGTSNRYFPEKVFDLTIPIWRAGEGLLHAEALARELKNEQGTLLFRVTYEGLLGRKLTSLSGEYLFFSGGTSRQNTFSKAITVEVQKVTELLPELVHQLLQPLYESFDFFELKLELVQKELQKMRQRR
jgi:transcriptional regulator with XRE-family HTH domain